MAKKIYCGDCLNLKDHNNCKHSSNLHMIDSWDRMHEVFLHEPSKINKNNDCPNYVPKDAYNKVYCGKCKHGVSNEDECQHPSNVRELDDWRGTYTDYELDCSSKNADNNCPHFEPRDG